MEKIISGKENRTEEKQIHPVPHGLKYVFAVARIVSMILLFASSVFLETAILSPVYIHNKFGIFSDLLADNFLLLMSVGACVAVGLLVWEGIYIVRLIVKRSLSRYTRDEGNAGK